MILHTSAYVKAVRAVHSHCPLCSCFFCFVQLLVVCEENSEGGGLLEYQMQQSEIPLRFFECAIEVQETKKEVQARGLVTLKFVPGPGEDSKKLTRIIEESFREHLHTLEESFLS